MPTQEEQNTRISNREVYEALEMGRQLMGDCEIRPETLADEPEKRIEWHRGSVAPNLFVPTNSGTEEEQAVETWRYLANFER